MESDLKPISETTRASLAFKTVLNTKLSLSNLDKSPRYIAKQLLMLDNQLAEHNLETEILNKYTQELITKISLTRPRKDMRDLEKTSLARMELAQLVNEFRDLKREEAIIDFADQMRFALKLEDFTLKLLPNFGINTRQSYLMNTKTPLLFRDCF